MVISIKLMKLLKHVKVNQIDLENISNELGITLGNVYCDY